MWVKINDDHLKSYADSIRYAKDGTEYTTTLERARAEIAEDNGYFEDISEAVQGKTGQVEPYAKSELSTTIDNELFSVSQLESKTITPETVQRTYTPQSPNIGFSSVTVEAATVQPLFSDSTGNCYIPVIIFPNTVTAINSGAYYGCTLLTEIVLSNSIESIGTTAFRTCSNLAIIDLSLYSDPNNLPTLGNVNAFAGTSQNKVFLVKNQSMLDAFAAATNWSTYADGFQIKGGAS